MPESLGFINQIRMVDGEYVAVWSEINPDHTHVLKQSPSWYCTCGQRFQDERALLRHMHAEGFLNTS